MKKKLSRAVCLLLCLVMLTSLIPMAAFAESDAGDVVIVDEVEAMEAIQNAVELEEGKPFRKLTVIGDSIAAGYNTPAYIENARGQDIVCDGTLTAGSYPELLAEALGIEDVEQCARCAWRTTDFLYSFEGGRNGWTYWPDQKGGSYLDDIFYTSLGYVMNGEDIKTRNLRMYNAIGDSDIISVNFGANDIFTYATITTLMEYVVDVDLENFALNIKPEAAELLNIGSVDLTSIEGLIALFGTSLKLLGNAGEIIGYFFAKCNEGLNNFMRDFPKVIDDIRSVNPDALIVVNSLDNPMTAGFSLTEDLYLDFDVFGNDLIYRANQFLRGYCRNASEYVFVDVTGASYYGLLKIDLSMLTDFEDIMNPLFAFVRVVHPDENGHRSIANRLISAIGQLVEPPVLTVGRNAFGAAELDWNALNGAYSYRIYRSTQPDKGYHLIAATPFTAYTDVARLADHVYYYRVVAVMRWRGTIASANAHSHAKGAMIPAVAPSCTKAGTMQYWLCGAEGCNVMLNRIGAEITDIRLAPTGHHFHLQIEEAAYLVPGSEASCTEGAQYYLACSGCGERSPDQTYEGAKAAHSYGDWQRAERSHYRVCSECHAREEHCHSYKDGYICTVCGYENSLLKAKLDAKKELETAAGQKQSLTMKQLLADAALRIDCAGSAAAVNSIKSASLERIAAQLRAEKPVAVIAAVVSNSIRQTSKVVKSVLSGLFR